MLTALDTVRVGLQILGATHRHEYDVADNLREQAGTNLRFHRSVTAVQATEGQPRVMVMARSARAREKSALAKAKETPRWSVRTALRVFGERYREAVGMAKHIVANADTATERNRQALRKALRFYGTQWRRTNTAAMAS